MEPNQQNKQMSTIESETWKNKLAVTRGVGVRGITGERRGRGKPRNMNRGLMGKDGRRGLTMGVGSVGQGRAMGKRENNCN